MDPTGTEKSAIEVCLFAFVMPSETSCPRQFCRCKKMSNKKMPNVTILKIGCYCSFKLFKCVLYFYENMMLCML
jgi:hypothetical protein